MSITNDKIKGYDARTVIENFCKSLDREIYHVRNQGGRSHAVSNGEYMGLDENEYAYYFEVESELHIADSSPVSLDYLGCKSQTFGSCL